MAPNISEYSYFQCGATYIYTYKGNDGVEIARIGINRDDCGY